MPAPTGSFHSSVRGHEDLFLVWNDPVGADMDPVGVVPHKKWILVTPYAAVE